MGHFIIVCECKNFEWQTHCMAHCGGNDAHHLQPRPGVIINPPWSCPVFRRAVSRLLLTLALVIKSLMPQVPITVFQSSFGQGWILLLWILKFKNSILYLPLIKTPISREKSFNIVAKYSSLALSDTRSVICEQFPADGSTSHWLPPSVINQYWFLLFFRITQNCQSQTGFIVKNKYERPIEIHRLLLEAHKLGCCELCDKIIAGSAQHRGGAEHAGDGGVLS